MELAQVVLSDSKQLILYTPLLIERVLLELHVRGTYEGSFCFK
jgi:hypothetical protein